METGPEVQTEVVPVLHGRTQSRPPSHILQLVPGTSSRGYGRDGKESFHDTDVLMDSARVPHVRERQLLPDPLVSPYCHTYTRGQKQVREVIRAVRDFQPVGVQGQRGTWQLPHSRHRFPPHLGTYHKGPLPGCQVQCPTPHALDSNVLTLLVHAKRRLSNSSNTVTLGR